MSRAASTRCLRTHQFAGVREQDVAVAFKHLVHDDPGLRAAHQLGQRSLALLDWRVRPAGRRVICFLFLESHRHSHHRNNDTDEGKTQHDAIGIELW